MSTGGLSLRIMSAVHSALGRLGRGRGAARAGCASVLPLPSLLCFGRPSGVRVIWHTARGSRLARPSSVRSPEPHAPSTRVPHARSALLRYSALVTVLSPQSQTGSHAGSCRILRRRPAPIAQSPVCSAQRAPRPPARPSPRPRTGTPFSRLGLLRACVRNVAHYVIRHGSVDDSDQAPPAPAGHARRGHMSRILAHYFLKL